MTIEGVLAWVVLFVYGSITTIYGWWVRGRYEKRRARSSSTTPRSEGEK